MTFGPSDTLQTAFPGFRIYEKAPVHEGVVTPALFIEVLSTLGSERDFDASDFDYSFRVTLVFKDGWRDPTTQGKWDGGWWDQMDWDDEIGLYKEVLAQHYLHRLTDALHAWTPDPTKVSVLEKEIRSRTPVLPPALAHPYLYGCQMEMRVRVRDAPPGNQF